MNKDNTIVHIDGRILQVRDSFGNATPEYRQLIIIEFILNQRNRLLRAGDKVCI